ncbi:MAG: hypothetical protein M1818_007800 [Claussenomyces sp. TS43310]|nr:MAG: hypothetical protein M1818_007800 [Claussenomyces sp. TS43310]
MAAKDTAPYVPQDAAEVSTLVHNLSGHQSKTSRWGKKKSFSCKKVTFNVADSSKNLTVDSWRFQDWDYKRDDLPTYARGLFTTTDQNGQSEIAIRGYDKFFNVGEVNATQWRNIERDTRGPYELSLKENGCIIFISGLSDDSLLVCSKHSTGPRSDALSHALAGEGWIDKQLKSIGKTRQDLARELRDRNATAVAELCDDSFEEHILAYTEGNAGLYLHGINLNVPDFATYSGPQVQAFADEWGFKRTEFLVIDDIGATLKFLDSVAETGHYNGRDVEGFVVRCKSTQAHGAFQDWFFKYKFEEPYLMYRQWRECTKAVISGNAPRYKKHIQITEEYLLYTRRRLAQDKELGQAYAQNHGIIGLRNDFLKEKNLKGSDIIRQEYAATGGAPEDIDRDVILVPIATIGCGKTTVAVALQHLFGWGHVQNDNITGKGRPPRFTKEVLHQLETAPVVIADRNNAQRHERKQIIEDVHRQHITARLIALNFVHSKGSLDKIRQVTQNRVFSRGDNHQTIQAATDKNKVVAIMEGFIHRFEPLQADSRPDDGFDAIIDLDPTADSRHNLETIVSELHNTYPKLFHEMPTSDDLDEAIQVALSEYKPDLRHDQQKSAGVPAPKRQRPLEYISVTVPHGQILNVLEAALDAKPTAVADLFRQLQQTHRVQPEFHVTLIHRASSKAHTELWERYSKIHADAGGAENQLGSCHIQLERAVWDNRLMAIVVRIVDEDWESSNSLPHITIGTRSPEIKPFESNDLLKRWLGVGAGVETGIGEVVIPGSIVVEGIVHGNLSR